MLLSSQLFLIFFLIVFALYWLTPWNEARVWILLAALVIGHMVKAAGLWRRLAVRLPTPVLGALYAVALNLVLVLVADQGKTFIYFQF
jgi:hypothetical protein